MTDKKKEEETLERVSCMLYPITFKDQTKALLDSGSKVNAIKLAFASQLGLRTRTTNVGAQKIDGTTMETYEMVVSTFSLSDKDGREKFFEKSYLLADVKWEVDFGMPFLTMSNANIDFQAQNLQWRSYTIGDVFPTTRRIELIEKKEFAAAALDPEYEVFVVHETTLSIDPGDEVYPSRRAQIAHLKADEALPKFQTSMLISRMSFL